MSHTHLVLVVTLWAPGKTMLLKGCLGCLKGMSVVAYTPLSSSPWPTDRARWCAPWKYTSWVLQNFLQGVLQVAVWRL